MVFIIHRYRVFCNYGACIGTWYSKILGIHTHMYLQAQGNTHRVFIKKGKQGIYEYSVFIGKGYSQVQHLHVLGICRYGVFIGTGYYRHKVFTNTGY